MYCVCVFERQSVYDGSHEQLCRLLEHTYEVTPHSHDEDDAQVVIVIIIPVLTIVASTNFQSTSCVRDPARGVLQRCNDTCIAVRRDVDRDDMAKRQALWSCPRRCKECCRSSRREGTQRIEVRVSRRHESNKVPPILRAAMNVVRKAREIRHECFNVTFALALERLGWTKAEIDAARIRVSEAGLDENTPVGQRVRVALQSSLRS